MPSPAAGKTGSTPRTPTKLGRKPKSQQQPTSPKAPAVQKPEDESSQLPTEQLEGDVKDKTEDVSKKAQDEPEDSKVEMKDESQAGDDEDESPTGKVSQKGSDLAVQDPKPVEEAEDTTAGAGDDAEDSADDATEKAGDIAEDTGGEDTESASGIANGAQKAAGGALDGVKDEAGKASDDVEDSAEQATGQKALDGPDLSILKGLEVESDGKILNKDGLQIGKLVEGDAEDLAGYPIGEDGEILDDDGDLIGRCDLTPEAAQDLTDQAQQAEDGPKLPDISILKGLKLDAAGQALNEEGDVVGQLVEGDVEELEGYEINEFGEILDEDGDLVGRVELHPDTANLVDQGEDAVNGVADEAGEAGEAGEAVDGLKDTAEDALPGIEALAGKEVNEEGQIVDEEGNVLANLEEGVDLEKAKGLTVNEKGEVIDEDGNVIGKVNLTEDAQEKLAAAAGVDLRILEGLKVNKKGKVLDEEGEVIGELTEGESKDCAGKSVNDRGEVVDKDGNVIGKVNIVPGEAADEALKNLRERLGDLKPQEFIPNLDILNGLKVNKKGKILNEDGEEIGELVDGELADCAGKKCNEKGEVLDADGNVIGRVKCLPQLSEEPVDDAVEDAVEDAGQELPPLSILEGLTVNKAGKLIDSNGVVVGELTEGDAKKLSKSGTTCDAEGQFWDNKGHVIGRAKTVQVEEPSDEAPFAGLEGLIVTKDGKVQDENGNIVGVVVEGDAKKLVGRAVDEDGDIIDKRGSVVGHAERYGEEEQEPADLSILQGRTVNKQGNVIGDDGVPIGRLVEGNPKDLAGKKIDENGQIWNDSGKVIGRVELIPENEREAKPEGIFAGLQGLRVVPDGKIADSDGNIVGTIVEGDPKRLVGLAVDEDGDILDKYGNVKGHAEPLEEEPEVGPDDLSILDGKVLNKQGFVVSDEGIPLGRLVEGDVKELAGRKCDDQGLIHNDTGKVVGRCELIPENERVSKLEGPFAGLEGLRVVKDGYVEDENGNVVGVIVEGDPKKLVGHSVDEDGDIIDKHGNVKGHADPYEEPEEQPVDLSLLAGCTVNKAGNVVDANGQVVGRVAEGELKNLIGKKVDGQGQIWDNAGNVVGRAELVQGADTAPEGPFSGFENATVTKDGTVQLQDGTIVGRIIEGDVKKLVGHKVDEDGDINDKNGNTIGKAERWEPEEKERRISPMAGRRVNKQGEVCDEDGNVIGRLTAGDLGHCVGLEIDDNGYVIDNDGNKVGEVTLLENIVDEEETEDEKQKREDAELADKMANICQQTLERIQPVCKQITEHIEKADRTPREELDEEELVNNVKPLIEEAGRILQECNGSLRGLDPDGRIASQAKGRANTREATPEEYRLADLLKELTTTVVTTIDNAKKRISDMPHAKKKLNPLWSLLTQPLFQILAAVGLLLTGVLGLVGQLLNALGLGGLVNGLLGGLGIDKLLGGLGLGSISDSLGGGKKKKSGGGGVSSIPLVGGILGGNK